VLGPTASASATTVESRRRQSATSWWLAYGLCIFATLVVAAIAVATTAQPFSLALVIMVLGAIVALVRPVAGVYLVALFAMVGDTVASGWYPFTWNFSSRESILFISDGITMSPLDLYVAALFAGWILQMLARRDWHIVRAKLFWPVMVFGAFMVFGFVHGVVLKGGGDRNAAVWEFRPMIYLIVLYLLVTNIFTNRAQYRRLLWFLMTAVCINGVLALVYYYSLDPATFDEMESLVQHGATLPMNAMILLIIGARLFRVRSLAFRWLLPVMAIPVVIVYVLSQRRAAIVALVGGLIVAFAVLNWTNRKLFWRITPVVVVLAVGYVGAFWNSTSTAGFPAQAVKSVVAPDSLSERNQGSDQYRAIENLDVVFTIKASPVLGLGFGQRFYKPYPLPAIASFLLEDFKPHNSILWIWIKAGIGGFIAMLFLFGSSLRDGARSILDAAKQDNTYAAFTMMSVAYVLMVAIFSYVDIAWDAQNMVMLAFILGQIGSVSQFPVAEPDAPEPTAPAVKPLRALAPTAF
jgi:hypothetical protein